MTIIYRENMIETGRRTIGDRATVEADIRRQCRAAGALLHVIPGRNMMAWRDNGTFYQVLFRE